MSHILKDLQPQKLWYWFEKLSQIPRGSKNEAQVMKWLKEVALEKNLTVKEDSVGNLVIQIPATPGRENKPVLVLQGHTDMVCEKNKDTIHDFEKDPIKLQIKEGWVTADGTTLGADNGIGVAVGLAIADSSDLVHGPIEVLLTIDEETGLTGAKALQTGFITGKTMINLDSEEEGAFYVGCAGGLDTEIRLPYCRVTVPDGTQPVLLTLSGLVGGHSGLNIIEGRGNAIQILGRVLDKMMAIEGVYLSRITGGSKRNAIPREAEAVLQVIPTVKEKIGNIAADLTQTIRAELPSFEEKLLINIEDVDCKCDVIADADVKRLIALTCSIPNGVIAMSNDIPDLVETSSNLGIVSTEEKFVHFITSQRSSIDSAKEYLGRRLVLVGELAGAKVVHNTSYPGWKPEMTSPILAMVKSLWTEIEGKEPMVKAIHAGLECGILGERFPGLDMVSYGPTITGAHSPDESLKISSGEKFWNFTVKLLEKFSE